MSAKHQYEDEINKRKVEIIESINDIPTALKERDYIRARILLNRSKDLLEKIVDIASIPNYKHFKPVVVQYIKRDEAGTPQDFIEKVAPTSEKKPPQKRRARQ